MQSNKNKESGIVYSSEHGKMCPDCSKPIKSCTCKHESSIPKSDGIVRVGKSTKGRKGKCITVITGIPLANVELKKLLKKLKQKLGTGGTIKDNIIEIQGDHINTLVDELQKQGYKAKRSGG